MVQAGMWGWNLIFQSKVNLNEDCLNLLKYQIHLIVVLKSFLFNGGALTDDCGARRTIYIIIITTEVVHSNTVARTFIGLNYTCAKLYVGIIIGLIRTPRDFWADWQSGMIPYKSSCIFRDECEHVQKELERISNNFIDCCKICATVAQKLILFMLTLKWQHFQVICYAECIWSNPCRFEVLFERCIIGFCVCVVWTCWWCEVWSL